MLDSLRQTLSVLPPLGHPVWHLGIFAFGACVGSFLNVCIYRWPRDLSVVHPGSHCFSCEKPIKWYDNLPILSYFLLKGKCRNCKAGYSIRYAGVEVLTAVLFTLVWWKYHGSPAVMAVYLLVVAALIVGTMIDIDHRILPDRITIGGILLGPPLCLLLPELMDNPPGQFMLQAEAAIPALGKSLIGLAFGYWIISLVTGGGEVVISTMQKFGRMTHIDLEQGIMGYGDFKLLAATGAFFGWKAAMWTLFAGSFLGAVFGLALILMGKRELGMRVPFGPYLAAAVIWWMLGGSDLLTMYFNSVTRPGM